MSEQKKVWFHPKAVDGFDESGRSVSSSFRELVPEPAGPSNSSGFIPKAEFKIAGVENLRHMVTDPLGVVLRKTADVDGKRVGLDEDAYLSLRKLSEKIQRTEGFRNAVSLKALDIAIFEWALETFQGKTAESLCGYLTSHFESSIVEYWVWIPIQGLTTEFDFDLGRIEIHPFRPAFFETWEASLRKLDRWDQKSSQIVDFARGEFQGHAAGTIRVVAERIRAREIAFQEVEAALAILRVLQPCIMHPLLPSHIRPIGREFRQGSTCIMIVDDLAYPPDSHGEEPFEFWSLDEGMMDLMISTGLGAVSALYCEQASDYEKDLWASISTYSRSSLQKTPEDRLIYVFRALESFLLKSKNESIQQNIADRIAFTIAEKADDRRAIVKNVVKVYGLRSDSVHHNQSIEETDLLIEFLQYVFRFFALVVGRRKEFATRQEFLDSLDELKYA